MRDDTTVQPTDLLGPLSEEFERDPANRELFRRVHAAAKKAGLALRQAEVCERHAPHEADRAKAAALFSEAAELRFALGDETHGDDDLRRALTLDVADETAAARMSERLCAAGRFAEAAELGEAELAALEGRAGGALASRRAARHRALGMLWHERLGRVDRAIAHLERAWELDASHPEALSAAREIHASLGDERKVARLYELELAALGDRGAPDRRALLLSALGRLCAKRGDTADAARRMEQALALAPRDEGIKEALAELYAAEPDLPSSDKGAVDLYLELAAHRRTLGDLDGAITYLRRALGTSPSDEAAGAALEDALAAAERWQELERHYRHLESLASDDAERAEVVRRRAGLLLDRLGDRDGAKGCLETLAQAEPAGGAASRTLRQLYAEDGDYAELATLVERELDAPDLSQAQRVSELFGLATLAREHLGDRERAGEYLRRILTIETNNAEALARYADHFRDKRDWRGLADLAQFAVDAARAAEAPPAEIVKRLEELAQVSELRLGDVERSIAAWRAVEALDRDNPKAREAIRRLASRAKMWESLVDVLEKEASAAQGARERADALKRIAQVYRERQVDPRRAIALYEEALELHPNDPVAIKALIELYEREGDDGGLARALRIQLESEVHRQGTDAEREGRRAPTVREWPQAARIERLTTLRRLAVMFENRLGDVEGVVYACTGILDLLPGDRDALDRMERVLEKAEDQERLEQTLVYHAEAASGPAERAKVLRRLAKLAETRGDDVSGVDRWEKVLRAAPNDGEALAALSRLYERIGRWAELAVVLERMILVAKAAETPRIGPPDTATTKVDLASADPAARAAELRRYARVVDSKLGDPGRATRAWRQVLELLPRDREALDALARLYEEKGEWRELADVLGRQAPLYLLDDRAKAAQVALRRAQLLEERLGAPADAAQALETLIREVDPANLGAHELLRRIYESAGELDAAVRIAERELHLEPKHDAKVARALEIGALCRDRLHDARRALQAYERALAMDASSTEALAAAAELYAQVGDWARHVGALEKLAAHAAPGRDRRALYLRIGQAVGARLGDTRGAFGWYRRAHEQLPESATLNELRRAAEQHGLWNDLAEVLESERERLAGDPRPYVALCRELAMLRERRQGDRRRALGALGDAIEVAFDDEALLGEAERVAFDDGTTHGWQLLLAIYDLCLEKRPAAAAKIALLERRARVREEKLGDASGALGEMLRAFGLAPEREATRDGILHLCEKTGRWEDAVAVEATLLARATSVADQVIVQRRAAALLETKVKDRVRAFRGYLRAFRMAPDDPDVIAQLWRLAKSIGKYAEKDQVAKPEPALEAIEAARPPPPVRRSGAAAPPPVIEARTKPKGESTIPLDAEDLLDKTPPPERRTDRTIELAPEDLLTATIPPRQRERPDKTIELSIEDLAATALGPGHRKGPPAPPPPLPGVSSSPARPPARRPPLPAPVTAPAQRFSSAWEELASAYEGIPAADLAARLRNLFRAAEVWERGAADLPRAFATLDRALRLAPDDPEPRARLHRLAADHGAWDTLADLYEAAVAQAASPAQAAALLAEVADIRMQQGRPRDAEGIYRQILGIRPEDAGARERIEAIYAAEARWVDLAASLEERTDPRLGSAAPEAERPALLRHLARIYDEKLGKPYEAIAAIERLLQLHPDDLDALEELAAIYGRLERWAKVVESLGRLCDLAEGSPRARAARRRVGEIYAQELELPERAIEAYEALVGAFPDDQEGYAALDRLFEAHARWQDLAEVLRKRAALVQEPAARAGLLRRRSRVLLEWLGRADEAVACLRHARTITPEDVTLAEEMVAALATSGRAREAAAVLESRIAEAEQRAGAPGDVAALLLRLAAIRADDLDDVEGARKALEKVLARVPDHPSALAALAKLARGSADPRTYAEARLREAAAAVDLAARVEALLEAGATFRDRVGDLDAARDAFRRVLELEPANPGATWALSALVATGGDLDVAAQLLERRLAGELPAEERARVLTELGALAQRAGVPAAAERRLDEALAAKPDHLPAVIARADLYRSAGRHGELETFLQGTLPRLDSSPGDVRAELIRRLAEAYEQRGAGDEAYARLLEADKLQRNDLLTKLALGENRYRARRWREAALHLGGLVDHPQAPTRAAEVAEGLYHAALAEIRSLRPERAPALYRAALALKPDFVPALHALAEHEMEQGDVARAAELLERQAAATREHGERLRLYEALGDLAQRALGDPDRARHCYEAAVAAASPLESRHVPLLGKLLERQRAAGEQVAAGRTCELCASFAPTTGERVRRLVEAAEAYLQGGDRARGRAAAERAVQEDSYDEDAVWLATELQLADGDVEAAASQLGRTLPGLPPADEARKARRAELWRRLGDARRSRGDGRNALVAYDKSVAEDPDADGALAARRAIVDLLAAEGGRADQILGHLRALVVAEQRPPEVLRLARALATVTAAGPVDEDGGRATLELAAALGQTLSDEDRAYLAAHPPRVLAADEAYGGALDERDHEALTSDPDDAPLAEILTALWEAAPLLFTGVVIPGTERVPPVRGDAATNIYPQVVKAIGAPATVLLETRAPGAADVTLVCASPPLVVLGPRLLAAAAASGPAVDHAWDAELRFLLGRVAYLARPARAAAAGLPQADFARLVAGVARVAGGERASAWLPPGVGKGEADAEAERLKKTLPLKVRMKMEPLVAGAPLDRLDPARYAAACARAADRAGLIVCGTVAVAIRLVGGAARARHLVQLAVNERYLAARAKLGIGATR